MVSLKFNVMKDVASREYLYRILNRRSRPALDCGRYFHVVPRLNEKVMERAAKLLIGEHDFASFVTAWDRPGGTVRRIFEAAVARDGDEVAFRIRANAFLTHQVRNIVGTLVKVGTGKITIEDFNKILEMKKLSLAGPTAPAQGLCLMKVIYTDNSEFKYENLRT
jgi:tRNA pseudouridine38-40 synthase